ncbi:hypothetical protein CSC64_03460 [Pseudoxanthomonas koreensis]|nr:hypothetical protein CSC64_03460 [Pseudoxanthomonas koreensis]
MNDQFTTMGEQSRQHLVHEEVFKGVERQTGPWLGSDAGGTEIDKKIAKTRKAQPVRFGTAGQRKHAGTTTILMPMMQPCVHMERVLTRRDDHNFDHTAFCCAFFSGLQSLQGDVRSDQVGAKAIMMIGRDGLHMSGILRPCCCA